MPSEKQIAANQQNAQQSTGPSTTSGKAVSRMNALKHGALAKSVLVKSQYLHECPRAFKKLCREYYQDLTPVGPLEEMLVNEIVTAAWRLRRARRAESGEISLSVDTGTHERETENRVFRELLQPPSPYDEGLVPRLQKSAIGCQYIIQCLKLVRLSVEQEGELTAASLDNFKHALMQRPNPFATSLEQFRDRFTAKSGKLERAALRQKLKQEVMDYLDHEITEIRVCWLIDHKEREAIEEQARQSAAVLPSLATLDKLLRYQTTLERQMYRALDQLQKLKLRRQAENASADVGHPPAFPKEPKLPNEPNLKTTPPAIPASREGQPDINV